MLFWQLFTKNPNYFGNFILASSIKKKRKKIQNYWANNYSTKVQMLLGKRIILCSKPKTILWQKHILIYKKPQTYGKYKLLMTYYPSGPQTCLGYSMKDFGPNLFICRLTCDPTGRAPSSNQSVRAVCFSRKPFLMYIPSPFFRSSPSLFTHTPFPFMCITSFPCVYPYFPVFLSAFFPVFFTVFLVFFALSFLVYLLIHLQSLLNGVLIIIISPIYTHFHFRQNPKESSCFLTILLKLVPDTK